MKSPLVSTIITTYNRPSLLPKAIKSAINQTYSNQEIIVVNDGGKKISKAIKNKFPKVKFLRHSTNQGLSAARNLGVKKARGKYIAFLDDDDQWLPNKLEKQFKLAQNKDSKYGVFYCAQKITKPSGKTYINHPRIKGKISTEIIKKGLGTISSTSLFTKSALKKIKGFDESLKSNIDHDVWMALAIQNYWADYVDLPLVIHTVKDQPRMIGDYQPRIRAVNQYLKKWQSTINQWFGIKKGRAYSKNYYNYVIGWLAEEQFKAGKIKSGLNCLHNLLAKHPLSIKNLVTTPIRCLVAWLIL